ncbi:MAG: fructosamine kinase family protein [Balneolaceae bacterium]
MNHLPDALHQRLERESGFRIENATPIHGGDIHQALRLDTSEGPLFLKWSQHSHPSIFEREASGLQRLHEADHTAKIPNIRAWANPDETRAGYLLLDFLENVPFHETGMEALGRAIAQLHENSCERFGLPEDNYIGTLVQSNRESDSWIRFFIEERVEPQLKHALDTGRLQSADRTAWDKLALKLDRLFPALPPSLLHGDLWSGNVLCCREGTPALIDPAVYYGNSEMEIAFTKLFGGFSDTFYQCYFSIRPKEPGFQERIPIYQLYPLLVHTNLFGGHYAQRVQQILSRFS